MMSETRNVQAFINNISVPKSLEELQVYIDYGKYDIEDLLTNPFVGWTVPLWTKPGDIVFFMHAKYAHSYLTALRTALNNSINDYTKDQYDLTLSWINRGLSLHKQYGGKIFSIGIVNDKPVYISDDEDENSIKMHWNSKIYAGISPIYYLEHPIDISQFSDRIRVSRQGAITPIVGDDFDYLMSLISAENNIPEYLKNCSATPLPLHKINETNWMTISNEYRRSFNLEIQFRNFYVDHLLHSLSDIKTIYRECRCRKKGIADSFIDNVIKFNHKYLAIEVKLNVDGEPAIKDQLAKYSYTDYIILDAKRNRQISGDQIFQNKVMLIDTGNIYLYDADSNDLSPIFDLDDLTDETDIDRLKEILIKLL